MSDARSPIKTLIIVPARSGSKGVIDKNIKLLGGKPLLQWTCEAIHNAKLDATFSLLSTDHPQYAELGKQLGLEIPFLRPMEYATDQTPAMRVIQHALAWFEATHAYLPENTIWLQPTSPFRGSECLRQALDMIQTPSVNAVVGCYAIHRNLTTLFRNQDGFLQPLDSESPIQTSRQQNAPLLTPNGALYLCKTSELLARQSLYPPKTQPLVMDAIQSLDIDTEEDWAIAEAFIQQGLL